MIESAQIVLALSLVVVVALFYWPRGPSGGWAALSDAFATRERPRRFGHLGQRLNFRAIWPVWWTFPFLSGEYGTFDVEFDSHGIWLLTQGPQPRKCAECLLIPWTSIVRANRAGQRISLELRAKRPIWMELPPDLGRLALAAL
jgi:hypothetical protein